MILEHGKDPVSARWDKDHWDIGERTKYRWTDNQGKATSHWFHELNDALQWIKEHDESLQS